MALSWLDTILVLLIGLHAVIGIQKGLLRGAFALVSLVATVGAALGLAPFLAKGLGLRLGLDPGVLALALAFLLVVAANVALSRWQMRVIGRQDERAAKADRLLGVIPGLIRGGVIGVVISTLYVYVSGSVPQHSPVAHALASIGKAPMEALVVRAQEVFPGVLVSNEGWELITSPAATQTVSATALEKQMLALVNRERQQAKLPPLTWDGILAIAARVHSQDMLAKDYFAHETPDGKSVAHRATRAGARFLLIGENLAYAPTLEVAHRGLMKSPGHRDNILHPEFRRLGIGIIQVPKGERYTPKTSPVPVRSGHLIVTQVFAR